MNPEANSSRKVAVDIETKPLHEGGNALDPEQSSVESFGFWGYDEEGRKIRRVLHISAYGDERTLLIAASAEVIRMGRIELIGWNTSGFDLPFLAHRYAEHRLEPIGPQIHPTGQNGKYGNPEYDGFWQHASHRDIYRSWKPYTEAAGIRNSLKPVAAACGLNPIEIDTTRLDEYTVDEVISYQLSDVRCTYQLDEIPFDERAARLRTAA